MASRMQQRRGTASQWTSANPVLESGEIGWESDTNKFKIGNGLNNWANLDYFADINSTVNPAFGTGITFEGSTADSFETTLQVTDPTADRTITIPDATGTVALTTDITTAINAITTDVIEEGSTNKYFSDERAQDAISTALAAGTHTNITITYNDEANSISFAAAPGYVDEQAVDAVAAALAAGTHTNISVSYNDSANSISLTGAATYSDENAQDAIGNSLGVGLSYNDTTGAISVDTTTIQARVTDVSDTEIGYLNGVTSAIQTQLNDKAPIASPTFTGTVTLPGAPTSDLHAATKAYVDAVSQGLHIHASAKGYFESAVDLIELTPGAVNDSVTFAAGDRVLLNGQSTQSENGIYVINESGPATRALDFDSPAEVNSGDFIFVTSGTTYANTGWVQTLSAVTIGSSPISFTQFSGAGTYLAGNGLSITGNTFSINTAITADLSTAQTLTNKTLTSPKINEDVAVTATATELNYVDGVTSAIQTQIDAKAPLASPTFTGTVTLPGDPTSDLHAATKAYVDNISTTPGPTGPTGPTGATGGTNVVYSQQGTLAVTTGLARYYLDSSGTVTRLRASVGTAPTGSSLIVTLFENGVSIGTATIAAGAFTATTTLSSAYVSGDYLTASIAQVGSTIAGTDLTITVTLV